MRANQPPSRPGVLSTGGLGLRLWFASMAYVLVCALRRIALTHTQFARASCGTIRLKLLKIGALVRTSVRRIKLAMLSAFAYQADYRTAHAALTANSV